MSKVFIERIQKPEAHQLFNVGVTLGRKSTKGDIGIEVEVEGKKLPKQGEIPSEWAYHIDHSLRGSDNGEYVLITPLKFEAVDKAIDGLWDSFRAKGSHLDDSNRTSVHIHLNVQQFHLNRLTSFMALYYAVEDILAEWCGDHRVGNLFCLRGRDAPAIVNTLRRFIKTDMQWHIQEHHHYAALNANALHKFGSLEIRTLRGVTDPTIIKQWVGILRRLYELSADFADPREICYNFSAQGPMAFFEGILAEHVGVIRSSLEWTDNQIRESVFDGIRMAQDLCFCRDWSMFKGVEFKPDPFGRDPKKLLKRMQTLGAQGMDVQAALEEVDDFYDPDMEAEEVGYEGELVSPTLAPTAQTAYFTSGSPGLGGAGGAGGAGVGTSFNQALQNAQAAVSHNLPWADTI